MYLFMLKRKKNTRLAHSLLQSEPLCGCRIGLTCKQLVSLMHAVFKDSLDKRIALAQGMLSEWLRLGPSILLTPPLPCTSSSRVVAAIGMYHRVLDPENFTMVLDHVDSNNRPDFMYRVGAGHESSQK